MKRVIVVLVLLFLVAGCATTKGLETMLDTWVGSDVDALVMDWGPPADVYELSNGSTMYTWRFDGGAVAVPVGNMAYAIRKSCEITITTDEQKIIQTWRWKGNMCRL